MISGNSNKNMKDKVTLSWNTPATPRQPQPAPSPSPAPEKKPESMPVPEVKPEAAPDVKPQELPAEAQASGTVTDSPANAKKKSGWGAIMVDGLLVVLLLGALGGGAWYVHQQMEQYRVPSPLELAKAEHLELCKQHEQLQDAAYKADEQLHMRERITHLDLQIDAVKRQLDEHRQGIEAERGRIFSLQREIRQEDKTSRGVARNLLIGLPIGNVSTTNGRAYANASIHRMEAGRITLRTPQGQVRFPLSQLVKDNLPDMVRYALGIDDMVDMSDFEAAPGEAAPRKHRHGKLISPRRPSTQVSEPNYEPAPGAPVVDAPTQPNTITVEPGTTPAEEAPWEAPEGALPIGE